jgi:hypothetical protein
MEEISPSQIPEDFAGECTISLIGQAKPLIVERDEQGTVQHVGVKLFSRDLISRYPSPLYTFVERYFLELLLERDDEAISTRLHLERVKLDSDLPATGGYKAWIRRIIQACAPSNPLTITCVNNRYMIRETEATRTIFTLYLPVRHELITGLTKPEAERALYRDLQTYSYADSTEVADTDYYLVADSVYCLNDEYYGTEEIVSTSYYRLTPDGYRPIFGAEDPVKSVYNLFNTPQSIDLPVQLTQSFYGQQTAATQLPLSRLTHYLRAKGCTLYTGIRSINAGRAEGVVMAVNAELGYQHFLRFTVDGPVWQKPDSGTVSLKMYSFIPIHNISVLLDANK